VAGAIKRKNGLFRTENCFESSAKSERFSLKYKR
jgi:hypothetical protein